MDVIRIKDFVVRPSTYEDGQVIFQLISPSIQKGLEVEVSFAGVHAVPSAFVNAAFVQLLEHAPSGQVKACLRISNSTKFINELIKRRFDFVENNRPRQP